MLVERSSAGGRRSRARRAGRFLLRASLVGVALLGLAYAFRARLLAPLLVGRLRELVRARLGAELAIESVSGNWFGELVLTGVQWRSERPPLLRLDEGRIALRYSLLRWVRGEAAWIETVELRGRGIELELGGDAFADEPRSLTLPELAIELELDDFLIRPRDQVPLRLESLRARASLSGERLAIAELEARAGANRLTVRQASLDLAAPDFEEGLRGARGELALLVPDPGALLAGRERFAPLRGFELALALDSSLARITGRCELEGGSLVLERGEIALPESAALDQAALALDLDADFADLAPLGRMLGRELDGGWIGALEIRGRPVAPVGRFVGRGERLELAGLAIDTLEIEVETDGVRARIERALAHGAGFEARASGELGLEPLELRGVELDLHVGDPAALAWFPLACTGFHVHAELAGPPLAPSGSFRGSATDLRFGALHIEEARALGRLEGAGLEFDELELELPSGSCRATGALRREPDGYGAELASLELDWEGGRVELGRPAALAFGARRLAVEGLELVSGNSRARLALALDAGEARATLELEDFDTEPFAEAFLYDRLPDGWKMGKLRGRLDGARTDGQVSLSGELAIEGLRPGVEQPEWSFDLAGGFGAGRLELDRLLARSDDGQAIELALHVPFDPAQPVALLDGDVRLRLAFESGDLVRWAENVELSLASAGPARITVELDGRWDALAGSATLALADLVLAGRRTNPGPWDVDAALALGERVTLERAEISSEHGRASLGGTLEFPADLVRLLEDPSAPARAALALQAELDLPDVGWIAALSAELRRVAGRASGHLGIAGTLAQPELTGELAWHEGELRLASDAPPVSALSAELRFRGRTLEIVSLAGEIGGAPVHASGTVEPFGEQPRFDLEVSGENLLLARSSRLRLRTNARLTVRGPLDELVIGGELVLTEGRFTSKIDPLKELLHASRRTRAGPGRPLALTREPPLADAVLDVSVRSVRGFTVETNLGRATLRPDFRLMGSARAPTASGAVYVERASLSLPSGKLELVNGVLQLREDAPFRPEAALTAELRTQGYDVRASAVGSLDELEISLSSNPPLGSDDLWVLVLTGQPPLDRWQDRSTQAMEALALFLARDHVVRWFSEDPDDSVGLLERFEIDVGAKTSQSGRPTGRVAFYLKPRTGRSGRATYLSAAIDEYDRVNYALGIVFRPR